MRLILYSKPGCHLCEGLEGQLKQIETQKFDLEAQQSQQLAKFDLEIRDITTSEDWFTAYQYEIPVLRLELPEGEKTIPRFSPRMSVDRLAQQLDKYLQLSDDD